MAVAVEVRGLESYGDLEAVAGVDFAIEAGEVFSLLGPNGAGKTTTVEILEGYGDRDAGEVTVLGLDPAVERARLPRADRRRPPAVRPSLPGADRARGAPDCSRATTSAPRDVDEVLALVGLEDKAATTA